MKGLTAAIQRLLPTMTTLACILLAGWIWMPFNNDATSNAPPDITGATDTQAEANTEILESGAQQLVARPLFHISRRPPAEVEAAPAAPEQVTLSLTGVLDSDDVQIALLRLSNNPELLRRRVGEQVGEWRIIDITKTSITVVANNGEEQIIGLSSANP